MVKDQGKYYRIIKNDRNGAGAYTALTPFFISGGTNESSKNN